jgi:hypothetical protein
MGLALVSTLRQQGITETAVPVSSLVIFLLLSALLGLVAASWPQSGSTLSGTIKLEAQGESLPVHGTLSGDSIQFGTVGSTGITYKGTVSGNSMSARRQDIGRVGNGVAAVDHRLVSADLVDRQGDPYRLGGISAFLQRDRGALSRAVLAVPRQRAVGTPFGAYSYSYPMSDGQVVPTVALTMWSA